MEVWASIYRALGNGTSTDYRESTSALAVLASNIDQVIFPTYTWTGLEFYRYDPSDFTLLGNVPALTDNWDYDNTGILYDPSGPAGSPSGGVIWIPHAWMARLGMLLETNWSFTEFDVGPVNIPAPLLPYYGGSTQVLTTGYYVPVLNSINDDVYFGDLDQFSVFHRIDKDTGEPAQTYYMVLPNINQTSPYSGVGSTTTTTIFFGAIVFISATEAYMTDFNNPEVFHCDLTTGEFTFVFQFEMDPPYYGTGSPTLLREARTYPVHYDSGNNTLWFISYNSSAFEAFTSNPGFTKHSLFSWVVGSHPNTMTEYVIDYDNGLIDDLVPGIQEHWFRTMGWKVDPLNNGVWVEYGYSAQDYGPKPTNVGLSGLSESLSVWRRFFSFDDLEFTKFGVNSVQPINNPYLYGDAFSTLDLIASSSHHWIFTNWDGSAEVATRFYRVDPDFEVQEARYVRVTLERQSKPNNSPGLGGGIAGLQEVEVHSTLGGADIAVSISASSENGSFPASNLLDGDLIDSANGWRAANADWPQVLTIDLGSIQPVFEVLLWPLNLRETGVNPGTTTKNWPTGTYIAPQAITIELSDDGITWDESYTPYKRLFAWPVALEPTGSPSTPSSPRQFLVTPIPRKSPQAGILQIFGYEPTVSITKVHVLTFDDVPEGGVVLGNTLASPYHTFDVSAVFVIDQPGGSGSPVNNVFTEEQVGGNFGSPHSGGGAWFTHADTIIRVEVTAAAGSADMKVTGINGSGTTVFPEQTIIPAGSSFPTTNSVDMDFSLGVKTIVFSGGDWYGDDLTITTRSY